MTWKYDNEKLWVNGHEVPLTYTRTLNELRPVLKDPQSNGPNPAYWVFRDIHDPEAPQGERSDITILALGTIGEEYVKTHGHYHLGEGIERYKLLRGQGLLMLQKPSAHFERIENVQLLHLVIDQLVAIPQGWGHTLINTGQELLVAENFEPLTISQIYTEHEKMHGAAYYILEKEGQLTIETNPSYQEVPRLQTS
jgi:glucose-6-phosphate isomerase